MTNQERWDAEEKVRVHDFKEFMRKHVEIILTKESKSIGGGDYADYVTGVELHVDGEFLMEGDES